MVVVVVLGETDFARVRQPWPWGVTSQCTRQLGRRLQPTSQRRLPTPGGGGGSRAAPNPVGDVHWARIGYGVGE